MTTYLFIYFIYSQHEPDVAVKEIERMMRQYWIAVFWYWCNLTWEWYLINNCNCFYNIVQTLSKIANLKLQKTNKKKHILWVLKHSLCNDHKLDFIQQFNEQEVNNNLVKACFIKKKN